MLAWLLEEELQSAGDLFATKDGRYISRKQYLARRFPIIEQAVFQFVKLFILFYYLIIHYDYSG